MTLHITVQVVADDRGDAIRLIRDAAGRVKQGRNEGEWQHCMGAYRIAVVNDDVDTERSRFADNDEYGREHRDPISGAPMPRVYILTEETMRVRRETIEACIHAVMNGPIVKGVAAAQALNDAVAAIRAVPVLAPPTHRSGEAQKP